MIPPTSIDGTDITGATIDGTDVQEITVDGDVVFSAGPDIPDANDLFAHYDASQVTSVDPTWAAQVGPDLTVNGSANVVTSGKNGLNIVRYPGRTDGHEVTWSSSQSQPNHIFLAFKLRAITATSSEYLLGTETSANRHDFAYSVIDDNWFWRAPDAVGSSTTTKELQWNIASILWNGSSSVLRINGTQVGSGDVGSDSFPSFSLGYLGSFSNSGSDCDVAEVLYYSQDKSSIATDVENYLNAKWDIF